MAVIRSNAVLTMKPGGDSGAVALVASLFGPLLLFEPQKNTFL